MNKSREYYLSLPYEITIKTNSEKTSFKANYKEYPKVKGVGHSEIEAIKDLKSVFANFVDKCLQDKILIKEPKAEEEKERISILIRKSTIKKIKGKTNNRSAWLDKAAAYIIENNIEL
ncbi:type II toxin-antitoxin system HicB family antitoxin [Campylobacter sp. RM16188]|uniref:type II toxin-antitoxin system HicB family antitoxin n=1 Tax=Campylobacter sp. RM16188 TaxID=1705725 RepID=UPI00155745EC|nr:type II toxin-antitoxin system HicB family antitoxin [Campylobacter sp. RM16188]